MYFLDLIHKLCRFGLGGIFIYAGASKLLTPGIFATLIGAYGLLPEALLLPFAIFLLGLEVAAGIGLVFNIKGSLAIITGLLVLFIFVLGYGIHLGLDVDCGCFSPGDPEAKAFHGLRASLYRDLVMLAGVAYLAFWPRRCRAESLKITTQSN